MPEGDFGYLFLAIGALTVFAVTLAVTSWIASGRN